MNEAETRAEHVDPALAAAGWGVVEGSRVRREYPITLRSPTKSRSRAPSGTCFFTPQAFNPSAQGFAAAAYPG